MSAKVDVLAVMDAAIARAEHEATTRAAVERSRPGDCLTAGQNVDAQAILADLREARAAVFGLMIAAANRTASSSSPALDELRAALARIGGAP